MAGATKEDIKRALLKIVENKTRCFASEAAADMMPEIDVPFHQVLNAVEELAAGGSIVRLACTTETGTYTILLSRGSSISAVGPCNLFVGRHLVAEGLERPHGRVVF